MWGTTVLRKFFSLIISVFVKKDRLYCGGSNLCEVTDRLGRVLCKIYYTRPDTDMVLEYVYAMQTCLTDETDVEKLISSKEKGFTFHKEIYLKTILPFAEKIFLRSEGYLDENGKKIDKQEKDVQYQYIKKYFSSHLAQLVTIAYSQEYSVKKKY